jgi:hypothetical protein
MAGVHMPGDGMAEVHMPGDGMAGVHMPGDGIAGVHMPGDGMAEVHMPGDEFCWAAPDVFRATAVVFPLHTKLCIKYSCTNHKAADNSEFTCYYRLGGPQYRNTFMEHSWRLRFGFFKILEKFAYLCNSLTQGISQIKQFTYLVTLIHVHRFNSLRFS